MKSSKEIDINYYIWKYYSNKYKLKLYFELGYLYYLKKDYINAEKYIFKCLEIKAKYDYKNLIKYNELNNIDLNIKKIKSYI